MYYDILGDLGPEGSIQTTSDDADNIVKRITLKADYDKNRICACVSTNRGVYKVYIPLGAILVEFDAALEDCGVPNSDAMQGIPTLRGAMRQARRQSDSFGGFGSFIKRATKSVAKVAAKAHKAGMAPVNLTKSAARKVGAGKLVDLHEKAEKVGKKAVRSKYTGAALTVAAVAYPPIGAPALAAWTIANRVDAAVEAGKRAQAAAARGNLRGAVREAAAAAPRQVAAVKQYQRQLPAAPSALVRSALAHMPAGNSARPQLPSRFNPYYRYAR